MSARFRLALEKIAPAQWQLFEHLASQFLADEYGELRTIATPSGDEGRDATLVSPEADPQVAMQYSLASDWTSKARKTGRRLNDKHPSVSYLVYVTPHDIAARADDLKTSIRRDYRLFLDVRDRNWFAEREHRSSATEEAAEWFSKAIVDPLLTSAGVIDKGGTTLDNHEARAALLYLVLQRQDDEMNRQLTKLCFDAMVKAALRDTDNETRMSRSQVQGAVGIFVPSHAVDDINLYVDAALARMTKQELRHWPANDEYCLSHAERSRLREEIAKLELLDQVFENEIAGNIAFVAAGLGADVGMIDVPSVVTRVRRVLEQFLMERGEAFTASVRSGQAMLFVSEEIREIATRDLGKRFDSSSLRENLVSVVTETIERTLVSPSSGTQRLLRSVADGYTLFAFLRETPNVQSAVSKLFSQGTMWLDTSAILPLLAETLLDSTDRNFTLVTRSMVSAGASLRVTPGVVEEVNAHIDNCVLAYRLRNEWRSRTPFLLSSYIWSGRDAATFRTWAENFRGEMRPAEDLAIYLRTEHSIRLESLKPDVERADPELRAHAFEYWLEVHEERRARSKAPIDPETIRQLAEHDLENFLGVLSRRATEHVDNAFGYVSWWLTLDRLAFEAANAISERMRNVQLSTPVIGFEFLSHYLSVGPMRRQLEKTLEQRLPLMMDVSLLDAPPARLLQEAEAARKEFEGLDERVVRRRIRDHLDAEKLGSTRVGRTTAEAIEYDIQMALTAVGKARTSD